MNERDEAETDDTRDDEAGEQASTEKGGDGPDPRAEGESDTPDTSEEASGDQASTGEAAESEAGEPAVDGEPADEPEPEPAVEPEPEPEPDPLAELQGRYDEAQARLRTVSKAYRELQAEMKAFRERMEARSKMNSELQAFDQARRFFDPVMNLKRSLQQPGDDIASLRQGLEMVQKQFMEAMEKLGLEEVPGEGCDFDPNVHEALAVTPVPDAAQDGKVLMVHTAGYTVKGKVLQAAQVVIGKHQEPAGEA